MTVDSVLKKTSNTITVPFVSGLIVLPRTKVLPATRESSNDATKSANTSAHSDSAF